MVGQGITSITMFFFFDYLCQVDHNPARNEANGSNMIYIIYGVFLFVVFHVEHKYEPNCPDPPTLLNPQFLQTVSFFCRSIFGVHAMFTRTKDSVECLFEREL